ncbi:MAG: hypothetical protein IJ728_10375 [Selenomonadaceae bacterium]|nr:hypothetical protein [Selenomonadaceae bacterium]
MKGLLKKFLLMIMFGWTLIFFINLSTVEAHANFKCSDEAFWAKFRESVNKDKPHSDENQARDEYEHEPPPPPPKH